MNTEISSKHGIVARAPYLLFMSFTDMRNFTAMLPEDKRAGIESDYDSIHGTFQGIGMGMRVQDRRPYSRISYVDDGAPFQFQLDLCFDAHDGNPDQTDFHIDLRADLNFMLKMVLGNRLREMLDKIVDGLVDMGSGKMPQGFNPDDIKM